MDHKAGKRVLLCTSELGVDLVLDEVNKHASDMFAKHSSECDDTATLRATFWLSFLSMANKYVCVPEQTSDLAAPKAGGLVNITQQKMQELVQKRKTFPEKIKIKQELALKEQRQRLFSDDDVKLEVCRRINPLMVMPEREDPDATLNTRRDVTHLREVVKSGFEYMKKCQASLQLKEVQRELDSTDISRRHLLKKQGDFVGGRPALQ